MNKEERKAIIAEVEELAESLEEPLSMLGGGWPNSEQEDYAEAILGVSLDIPAVVYSREKVINCLMRMNKWSHTSAEEWYAYNIIRGAQYEKHPPLFIEGVGECCG